GSRRSANIACANEQDAGLGHFRWALSVGTNLTGAIGLRHYRRAVPMAFTSRPTKETVMKSVARASSLLTLAIAVCALTSAHALAADAMTDPTFISARDIKWGDPPPA